MNFSQETPEKLLPNADDHEEGEIDDGDAHPMVTITKIDPKDIPEVSNKFLTRVKTEKSDDETQKDDEKKFAAGDKRRDRDRGGGGDRRDSRKYIQKI